MYRQIILLSDFAAVSSNLYFPRNFIPFRASELALPWNSECLGMSAFFCGITETVLSLFRGIFSERNSVPNPTLLDHLKSEIKKYTYS
jgi:hypothetical protein